MPWILVVASVVVAAIGASVVLLRRRRHVWATFARQHGLRYRDRDGGPSVEGHIDERPLRLHVLPGGSDADELGVQPIRMSLALRSAPPNVHVERAHGVIGAAHKAMEGEVVDTGDLAFDDGVLVRGPRVVALGWLVPARRDVIRRLLEASSAERVGIADGSIYVDDRSMISDTGRLEAMLTMLRGAAAQLDTIGAHA